MLILSVVAIIAMVFMIFSKTKYNIFIEIFFSGIGCSGIPTLLISSGSTIYKYGRGLLVTILFVSGNIGHSIAPYLIRFTSKYDMTLSISLSIFFMVLTMLFLLVHIFYKKLYIKEAVC